MMLVLIGDGRTRAYSMYDVVSAMFSSEGRRRRGASAAPSTAGVALSFGAMFAGNETTSESYGGAIAKYPIPGCQKRQDV
jgi:hypothetical protein